MLIAAVLTISDSSHRGTRVDKSGPAIVECLEREGWRIAIQEVLPDEVDVISARLAALADGGTVGAIFTTGGTGITPRDVTPEATRAILDKELPGLSEHMRSEGKKYTPRALLSRAVTGTRSRALIVNLPGSPKGAVESLGAIVDLVPHVLELLHGGTEHPLEPKLDLPA